MFSEKAALINTIIQTSIGCGLCLGPPIGSLLLPLGGYKCPFILVGSLEFLAFILGIALIPPTDKHPATEPKSKSPHYFQFLGNASTLSVAIPIALLYCTPGIRDTTYSLYFEDVMKLSPANVGFIFITYSVVFLITGTVVGLLVEKGLGSILAIFAQLFGLSHYSIPHSRNC